MIRMLVVARWPLGGIRTYMKYVYRHLDEERFKITLMAHSTQEDEALARDARENGLRLILHKADGKKNSMVGRIFGELRRERYDLIQSQGFTSGIEVYLANLFFRIPHVLTIHGVLEKKYLEGPFSILKKHLLARVLKGVTVIYAVSEDIRSHVLEQVPDLKDDPAKTVVIRNGIPVGVFRPAKRCGRLRDRLGIGTETFLFGFVGRFMKEKGFGQIIDAAGILENSGAVPDYRVLAIGSGDYLRHYRKRIAEKRLEHRFVFLPFRPDIARIYREFDTVLMPSLWEACPLQPMEALCSGIPLIASDCIGLREVVKETPARVFPSGDPGALAKEMLEEIRVPTKDRFRAFAPQAAERYDVRRTASDFEHLCLRMTGTGPLRESTAVNG